MNAKKKEQEHPVVQMGVATFCECLRGVVQFLGKVGMQLPAQHSWSGSEEALLHDLQKALEARDLIAAGRLHEGIRNMAWGRQQTAPDIGRQLSGALLLLSSLIISAQLPPQKKGGKK